MPERTTDLTQLHEAILHGDAEKAFEVTRAALAEAVDPQELLTGQMIPAMDEVGRRFEVGEYFFPELLVSARAMKRSLELVRPLLIEAGVASAGRVVIGTVKGDLHDIGKGLVASMLEGGGFEVIDLGVDVPPETFLAEAKSSEANVIALSALLTTTMTSMKTIIEAMQEAGLRDQFKVIIGGAPITQQYADAIGADGYSDSASGAVALVRKLVSA